MPASVRSAAEAVQEWQARGGTRSDALHVVSAQVEALRAMVEDPASWSRLVSISRRTADPWFATDWPDTFDPLVVVLPLCRAQDWDCASCPVGVQQHGRACAAPEVPVHRLGAAITAERATRAATELAVLASMLRHCRAES